MKTYELHRRKGEPGQVLGHVGDVVVFSNGAAVLQWLTDPAALEVYRSFDDLVSTRARSGNSVLIALGLVEDNHG